MVSRRGATMLCAPGNIGLRFDSWTPIPSCYTPSGTIQCKSTRVYLQMYIGEERNRKRERERDLRRLIVEKGPPKFSPRKRLSLTPVSFDFLAQSHVTVKWPISSIHQTDMHVLFVRQTFRKLYKVREGYGRCDTFQSC